MVQALAGHVRLLCPSNFQVHGSLHKHQFSFQPQVVFVQSTVLEVFVFSVGLSADIPAQGVENSLVNGAVSITDTLRSTHPSYHG